MSRVDVVTEIIIDQPLEVVAEYAANPDNAPYWYKNIDSANWLTPRPLSQGSKVAFTARFMGKTLAYTYEIIKYEPCRELVMRTAEGPFPMETTYRWQRVDGHKTHMTLRNAGNPKGFSVVVAPFMKWAMRRANRNDLKTIKEILEA